MGVGETVVYCSAKQSLIPLSRHCPFKCKILLIFRQRLGGKPGLNLTPRPHSCLRFSSIQEINLPKSAHKQSVVYDKINPLNMRAEKRLLLFYTFRIDKCWFSFFVSEKIFTHLPPVATYIVYFSVAANFND